MSSTHAATSTSGPNEDGLFSLALTPCTVGVLASVLTGPATHVWLRGFSPDDALRWTQRPVHLSMSRQPIVAAVRSMRMDVLLPVGQFMAHLQDLEHAGADLY